ncbi:Flp family type IVb pilin [Pandoraea nosoerga]|nr:MULTISPECIES: Flp family type IVb pilin [Pandoraea]MBN4665807.1 Flp family type IVb pilin [Pandoraea nosoerga]MBN4677260.1 Flp family type IVb pilin [Pandoraea nosoerga]MBN4681121.1 Flp family type IVb pilin [Pandoraea nosoerga]MBN4746386.1 Flp family type IVb pilin [Pandoraea nosoerga]
MRTRAAASPRRPSRERGVTALEYGILAAIVALVIGATVFTGLGAVLSSAFSTVTSAATSATSH